jgi:xyloglucan fucosyltransferase
VLLLHSGGGGALDDLFCEPFPGSAWILPADEDFPIRDMGKLNRGYHESLRAVLRRGGSQRVVVTCGTTTARSTKTRNSSATTCRPRPNCRSAAPARAVARVPDFQSDNYFVPGLFLNPQHEGELTRMFPRRDAVFHHLGRYLFHVPP